MKIVSSSYRGTSDTQIPAMPSRGHTSQGVVTLGVLMSFIVDSMILGYHRPGIRLCYDPGLPGAVAQMGERLTGSRRLGACEQEGCLNTALKLPRDSPQFKRPW